MFSSDRTAYQFSSYRKRIRLLVDRSIPAGIAILLLILLGLWHFADEGFLPAIALAMLVLALAEPS